MNKYEPSLFARELGDGSYIRVLDYLVENRDTDASIQDITEGTCLSRNTIVKILKEMETKGVIINTREVGRAKMYQLDTESQIAVSFIEFDSKLSRISVNQAEKSLVKAET